jgi:hypothetical protein
MKQMMKQKVKHVRSENKNDPSSTCHISEETNRNRYYTSLTKNFRVLDHVSRLHQSDLSKSCKHWDIFLSHCITVISTVYILHTNRLESTS